MKNEDQAWRELRQHAAAQLRPTFAERVVRATQGPTDTAWQQLRAYAAGRIRPGFAERVLRATRALPGVPSLGGQLAFGAATAGLCLLGVVLFHARSNQQEEERNMAGWRQLAAEVQDSDMQ